MEKIQDIGVIAAKSPAETLEILQSADSGLSQDEAVKRLALFGPNIISKRTINFFHLIWRQFSGNPLILILAAATLISYLLGQQISSYYIFGMIIVSILLGFWNDYSAEKTIDDLLKKITPTCVVERSGEKTEIPVIQLVIGDIVLLSPGSIIPADLKFLETDNLEVNQSILTGESKSVYKNNQAKDNTSLGFMGTSIDSGSAKGIVVRTGRDTEFGKIAKSTSFVKPVTEFQQGLAKFGRLLVNVILIFTTAIFVINAALGHPIIDSLLFSLAIAVGLTPELLPVIVTISLSHGANKLAKKHVVSKRLVSIENLGNIDILCTDKTGTLTEGKIEVVDYVGREGTRDLKLFEQALICNSSIIHHKPLGNGIDVALWEYAQKHNIKLNPKLKKKFEEPFDYNKRFMFSVSESSGKHLLVAKGSAEAILPLCGKLANKKALAETFLSLANDGYRVIALAVKDTGPKKEYSWSDAGGLSFSGYITFRDIPKKSAASALVSLKSLNVVTKVVTGDNEAVTRKVCQEIGMEINKCISGEQLNTLTDEELVKIAVSEDIFVKVTPEQKLRIISCLQKAGKSVGFLGDGINDIPALHAADVGITVNTAIDVAKDAASIVLLQKSLQVIADGIMEGRKTFNNTIKYILMGTSSNFGNMFSAAGASFLLPFLPMTPVQILLTNGLYDISQMSIPSDNVDPESLVKPKHWNIEYIKNYMLYFGPISSLYDFLTFFLMYFVFRARGPLFQTGWFIESLCTEVLVVFVIRTAKRPFFKSRPSNWLTITCLSVVMAGIILPFTGIAGELGFVAPPALYFVFLIIFVSTYLLMVELLKATFLKKFNI